MQDDSPVGPVLGTQDGYDRWSAIYDDDGNPLIAVEEPVFDRLIGNVENLDVLDVGCGTGRHAVQLAQRGARVTAVDFSSGMLDVAEKKWNAERHADAPGSITFIQHDLNRALEAENLPTNDGRYDRVVCALVLDHVHDLSAFFSQLRAKCRDDGVIIVTVMHPAMSLKGVRARFIDPDQQRRVEVESAVHTISDYVMAVTHNQLHIVQIEEHPMNQQVADQYPRGAKYLHWPILLAMSLSRKANA
ncbi:MAG: class I SAM-dependent methyltransferase [Phycisphaerae bacterium]